MRQLTLSLNTKTEDTYTQTHEALWDLEQLVSHFDAAEAVICGVGNHVDEYFPYGRVRADISNLSDEAHRSLEDTWRLIRQLRDRVAQCVAEHKVAA